MPHDIVSSSKLGVCKRMSSSHHCILFCALRAPRSMPWPRILLVTSKEASSFALIAMCYRHYLTNSVTFSLIAAVNLFETRFSMRALHVLRSAMALACPPSTEQGDKACPARRLFCGGKDQPRQLVDLMLSRWQTFRAATATLPLNLSRPRLRAWPQNLTTKHR